MYKDDVCVYPAQGFEKFKYKSNWKNLDFFDTLTTTDQKYYIERNADDYFENEKTKGEKFVTYWTPMKTGSVENGDEKRIGIIGF